MVALTVFGGVPRLGCICANGQHKFFCERQGNCGAGARCICCFGKATAKSGNGRRPRNAPSGGMACCRRARDLHRPLSVAIDADRPCRPIIDQSVLLSGASPSLDLDGVVHTPLFVASEGLPAIGLCTEVNVNRAEPLPPPGLVGTFGVLLI